MATRKTTKNSSDNTTQMRPVDLRNGWKSKAEREAEKALEQTRLVEYAAELKEATTAKEAAEARFAAAPDAKYAFHLHHEVLFEEIAYSGPQERIDFIMESKPLDELPTRLRLIRPVPNDKLPEIPDWAAIIKATTERLTLANSNYESARRGIRGVSKSDLDAAYYDFTSFPDKVRFDALKAASEKYAKANEGIEAARKERDDAIVANNDALSHKNPFTPEQIDALHKELCEPDCPWDGKTILAG